MAIDISRPNINAPTEAGRFEQVRSYLYQISEQLNWALNSIETDTSKKILEVSRQNAQSASKSPEEVESNFSSIKALIIKSADIVDAYYDEIVKLIDQNGLYVAKSDYGTFEEKTNNRLEADDKRISQTVESLQSIYDENGNIKAELLVNGHIYSGIIEYAKDGEAIIGIEIGQTTTDASGTEKFSRFAQFTAERLAFFNSFDPTNPVAYISGYELVITNARIGGTLTHGWYDILSTAEDGIYYLWREE